MRAGHRLILAATASSLLLASSVAPGRIKAEPTKSIAVGVGVGGVKLGMTADQVTAVMGQPVHTNRDGDRVVYMSFAAKDIFGVYFEGRPATVNMLIVGAPGYCTELGVCLGKAGGVARLKSAYGKRVMRFKEQDGEISFRILDKAGKRAVLTSFSPDDPETSLNQVMILYWQGRITD